MPMLDAELRGKNILITGGSTGLGRAIAEEAAAQGAAVTVAARGISTTAPPAGIAMLKGDTTDRAFVQLALDAADPDVLILNAGAQLELAPIDALSFEQFSRHWEIDVKAGLLGVQAAMGKPLRRGARVLLMSSGAAMVLGSPQIPNQSLHLSGGYVGAKYMLWLMAHNANVAARERDLDIHFQALLPTQLMSGTELGRRVASAYAEKLGLSAEAYLESRYGAPLTPRQVARQTVLILSDPAFANGVAFGLTTGPEPMGLDV